jgi:PAS domain S-box-containing protein
MSQTQSGTLQPRTVPYLPKEEGRENGENFPSEFWEARVGIAMVSLEGRFLAANRAFCEFLGYSEEELLRKDIVSVTHSADLARTLDMLFKIVMQGKPLPTHEKRYLHKDGRPRWGEVSATVFHGVQGQPKYFMAKVVDITDRKRWEEENPGLVGLA